MRNFKLGNFIRELREGIGMDQKTLAALLGVSSSAISQCENGGGIKIEKLYQLSELFGVTIDELLSGKKKEQPITERLGELYYIDENALQQSIDVGDYDVIVYWLLRIKTVRERFEDLIYKRIFFKITTEENAELEYLLKYYNCNIHASKYFAEPIVFFNNEHRYDSIRDVLSSTLGFNNRTALEWELNRIFSFKLDLRVQEVLEILSNDNRIETEQKRIDCLIALFEALPRVSKDLLFSQIVYGSGRFSMLLCPIIKPLIERGAKLLYLPMVLSLMSVDEDVIATLDGNTEFDQALSNAIAIYRNNYINGFDNTAYARLTYGEYELCINDKGMKDLLQLVSLWYSDKKAYWGMYKTLKLYHKKS
ncbi:MAG: helix-turn-helix transcriptional regulator [Clostridiales bacterium]|nr:helix-turn-helix transcriptional regulator [Clostridiales bacterium]